MSLLARWGPDDTPDDSQKPSNQPLRRYDVTSEPLNPKLQIIWCLVEAYISKRIVKFEVLIIIWKRRWFIQYFAEQWRIWQLWGRGKNWHGTCSSVSFNFTIYACNVHLEVRRIVNLCSTSPRTCKEENQVNSECKGLFLCLQHARVSPRSSVWVLLALAKDFARRSAMEHSGWMLSAASAMVSTRTGPYFRIHIEWNWHWHWFGLNRFLNYGQDILFAKKLGSAFWVLVVIELRGANATMKGWTRGPWHVVVDSHLELTLRNLTCKKISYVPQSVP